MVLKEYKNRVISIIIKTIVNDKSHYIIIMLIFLNVHNHSNHNQDSIINNDFNNDINRHV